MDGFEDRAKERNAHVDGEIQRMKKKMIETEKKLEKVKQKANASRPIHVELNITNNFHLSDGNSSKNQAKMQEMGREVGAAIKSMLLGTVSGDDNAQDCITISQE